MLAARRTVLSALRRPSETGDDRIAIQDAEVDRLAQPVPERFQAGPGALPEHFDLPGLHRDEAEAEAVQPRLLLALDVPVGLQCVQVPERRRLRQFCGGGYVEQRNPVYGLLQEIEDRAGRARSAARYRG